MPNRSILHCDMNNFYAGVECLHNPELRGKPVAVCGSVEKRRGIVLAKNYPAKAFGIKTGEAVWEAQQKCRNLIIQPPHYDLYMKYSRLARAIYDRYTDQLESMGADECWLDITGSLSYFKKTPCEIAYEIKETIKEELGLTISVGVSFNKIFAKLGSDMKKPDAVTVIEQENFRDMIWMLPASDMLGVGYATKKKLSEMAVRTIGDLAKIPPEFLVNKFGVIGNMLWTFANGLDSAPVADSGFSIPIKSVGHGSNALTDLANSDEVWPFMLSLTQDISHRLRACEKFAAGVAVYVRDSKLFGREYQKKFTVPTQSPFVLASEAFMLFERKHTWANPLRSVAVRAIYLVEDGTPCQLSIFEDNERTERLERLDTAVEQLRNRFGRDIVKPAVLYNDNKLPDESEVEMIMPSTGFAYSVPGNA